MATRLGLGWLFDSLEDVEHWAEITARVTHNHPEGIKGAQATAAAVLLARTEGPSRAAKARLRSYVGQRFGYDLSRTLDEIRPGYHHVESCQETVPEAITAYLEADSFEGAVRLAVSLGGDADTLGAIAGSIAEAAYGVPASMRDEALRRLPNDLRIVLDRFAPVVERGMARRLWSLVAPYADWLDTRPATPWAGGQKMPDGVITMAYPRYDERVDRLMTAFYDNGMIARDHQETLRRHGVEQPTDDIVATAGFELLQAMFTWIWRGERFNDGLVAHALEGGLLANLAHRAEVLAAL